jgi:hypothetical protein
VGLADSLIMRTRGLGDGSCDSSLIGSGSAGLLRQHRVKE